MEREEYTRGKQKKKKGDWWNRRGKISALFSRRKQPLLCLEEIGKWPVAPPGEEKEDRGRLGLGERKENRRDCF